MTANRSVIGARIVTQWIGILLAGWLALGTAWAAPVVHYLTVDGAGLRVNGGSVTNTSTWGNFRSAEQNDIGFGDSANEADTVFYSCALELTLTAAPNRNLADDPLYIDATAGDFRLQHGSPAIDAGLNQAWMIDAADLLGLPRILMGTVDMGCYEMPPARGSLFMFR